QQAAVRAEHADRRLAPADIGYAERSGTGRAHLHHAFAVDLDPADRAGKGKARAALEIERPGIGLRPRRAPNEHRAEEGSRAEEEACGEGSGHRWVSPE